MNRNTTKNYSDDVRDQPVDYSKKYIERNGLTENDILDNAEATQSLNKEFKENECKVVLFGDYAETDLDQPTDYSLRYAEDDTDEDEKQNTEYFNRLVISEKPMNYYKEDLPSNFSRVNSPTSLNSVIISRNNVSEVITKANLRSSINKEESERSDRNTTRLDNNELLSTSINNNSMEVKNSSRIIDKEGKMVTFGGQDYYAEQTPLMFSRCSSLGSLSGFEQHSIHDDRSSIVSDFSRRTSGAVSPSELPDSPTQTIPPSPRNQKIEPTDFMSKIQEEDIRPTHSHLLNLKSPMKRSSVFEDDLATFKEESTPIEFSTATSLSSLIIDDEMRCSNYSKNQSKLEEKVENSVSKETEVGKSFVKVNVIDAEKEQEQVSDGDEDDEDMLAACISMGIQNNRYRQSFKTVTFQKPTLSDTTNILMTCERKPTLSRLEPCASTSSETTSTTSKLCKSPMDIVTPDTVHIYCTEDTPAGISPVGSQSNLSMLSMPSVPEDVEKIEINKSSDIESHKNDLSDESYNLSDEDEKILDECIQSGIPKVRQITPPPTKSITFAKNPEAVSQKFDVCETPSSSPVESNHNTKNSRINNPLCHLSTEHEKEFSDESPNHSEDEAILIECIQSAKARLSCSPSPLAKVIKTSSSSLSKLQLKTKQQKGNIIRKPMSQECENHSCDTLNVLYTTEDSFSPSEEEEDTILAQCIQSGMPKVLNVSTTVPILYQY